MASGLRDQTAGEFAGTDRFVVQRRLGAGAMGVVYQCYDRERHEKVALKTLRRLDGAALYRFKQEFRALSDVTHPNLVALHELVSASDQWFFTMELVEGAPFLHYAREGSEMAVAETVTDFSGGSSAGRQVVTSSPGRPVSLTRLRPTLRQLAEGVEALHRAGKLHRDIKPSNVLVTQRGRVVLLDFGLVTELGRPTQERDVVGTAGYMAPEQGAGLPLSEATDWYSVGVMLYESLTGRLPFVGGVIEVLVDKQKFEPPAPRELATDVPEDLNALCVELLRKLPEARPPGRDVLRRLGVANSAPELQAISRSSRSAAHVLVGREKQLGALADAFARAREGHAVAAFVRGPSGMGKSALVQHFLDDLEEREAAVVLAGRCYERESVPFKAFDAVIDALVRHLMRLDDHAAAALMPRDVAALARVFPVLRRVAAVAGAPRRPADNVEPQELRRRAFGALRELLARLADQTPVVVCIDDVQWGDADSAALLADLLHPPDAPAILLIACFRSEDAQSSPLLRELGAPVAAADVREIEIGPLSHEEARAMAHALLAGSQEQAEDIAAESGGSPFFVDELVRHVQAGAVLSEKVSLGNVLQSRLMRLVPEARRLLDVVAVAGRPLEQAVAARAAELGEAERQALAVLRAGHLVRTRGTRDRDEIETYHDRIRETAVAMLGEAKLHQCHRRLAVALEGCERADPEALAGHWRAAGDTARAADYALAAAGAAAQALAFERAARLYKLALELGTFNEYRTRDLRTRLAEALANAGLGVDAAEHFLAASEGAKAADALELRRRAAELLVRTGHFERGLLAVRSVLAAVGAELPATPKKALLALVRRRLWLRLRGFKFKRRDETQIPKDELTRVDVCWTMAAVLSTTDTIRGAELQTRAMLMALEAGEPVRVAKALAAEAGYTATGGGKARKRTDKLRAAAYGLAREVDHPLAIALATVADGLGAILEGRWRYGLETCERAETLFREHYVGVAWEVPSIQFFTIWALAYLGELPEVARRVARGLKEAQERGGLHVDTNLRIGRPNLAWLIADDAAGARAAVDAAMAQWPQQGFHLQHYYALFALTNADLYSGELEKTKARMDERWPALAKSLCLRIQLTRLEALHTRGRVALATGDPDAAERDARAIAKENMAWANPLATLLRAGAAARRGNADAAAVLAREAAAGFDAADMALYAAAARWRAGESTEAWMRERKVVRPDRMVALLAPGW